MNQNGFAMAAVNEPLRPMGSPTTDDYGIKAMIAAVQNESAPEGGEVLLSGGGACDFSALRPASANSLLTDRKYSPTVQMLEQHTTDETLLKVKVVSSQVGTATFFVPVSLLVDRELEMRKSAAAFGIQPSRWTQSRLFSEWRNQIEEDISSSVSARAVAVPKKQPPATGEICITLDPENDCASLNQSHSFYWKPWLTTCIRAYYNTGTVRIPDDCMGSDILLALEFFGILYSPNQLVFDSFGGYLRVKMWSDYFAHRAKIADWVVQRLLGAPPKHSHTFVTSPNSTERACFVNSSPLDVLDGELVLDPTRYGSTSSRAVVYEFFNDDDEEEDKDEVLEKLDGLMRDDFAAFVQASLPGTNVSFTMKQVTVATQETVQRAVLRINFSQTSQAKPAAEPQGAQNNTPERPKGAAPAVTPQLTSASSPLQYSPVFTPPAQECDPKPDSPFGELSIDQPRAAIDRRSLFRRSKSEKSTSGRRAHPSLDEASHRVRIVSPDGNTGTNPWKHDEPSVDHPREAIDSTTFVRSLSEKIIRQTIADMDMDTIDHGLHQEDRYSDFTGGQRAGSNAPSDEGHHRYKHELRQKVGSRSLGLPFLDLDEEYGRSRDPMGLDEYRARATSHLEVIDDKYKAASDVDAPLAHVSVKQACDGSVLSALSSPWDESRQGSHGKKSPVPLRRQPSVDNLSDFRTTVDAFSMTDEMSVQIGPADDEARERSQVRSPVRSPKRSTMRFRVEDSNENEATCVTSFYTALCGPGSEGSNSKRRSGSRGRKTSTTDYSTSATEAETDEESSWIYRGKWSRARGASVQTNPDDDPIGALGDVADTFINGVVDNLRSMMEISGTKSEEAESRTIKKRHSTSQHSSGSQKSTASRPRSVSEGNKSSVPSKATRPPVWKHEPANGEDDDAVDDILSKLSEKVENAERAYERQHLPPRPIGKSRSKVQSLVLRDFSQKYVQKAEERPMDRIQSILKEPRTNHHASQRRSQNVLKNLELLQDANNVNVEDFGKVSKISRVETAQRLGVDAETKVKAGFEESKKRAGRKGLLSFLRKK